MTTYQLHQGTAPLLVSLPHDGSVLPEGYTERLTATARRVPDTDWHVGRLYAFARDLGASIIAPVYSRYVVDLNRPPDDVSLYPGQNTTGLCPTTGFDGQPIYLPGHAPDEDEVSQRVDRYWRPYHEALATELSRLRDRHGRVVLWEGHSIRSEVPFLFDGRLPVFNVGTAGGSSCLPALEKQLGSILAAQDDYGHVLNGRFKGGYITRHYGRPADGIDAVQLEMAQRAYMDESDFAWREEKAMLVRPILTALLRTCIQHASAASRTAK